MEIYQEKFWYNDVFFFLYGVIMEVDLNKIDHDRCNVTEIMLMARGNYQHRTFSGCLRFLLIQIYVLFSFAIVEVRDNPDTIREAFLKFRQLTTRFL